MTIVDRIMSIYTEHGGALYLGEAVTQMEHALQAATLAENAGAPDSQIAAALVHDIGHILHISDAGEADDSEAKDNDDLHEDKGYHWLSAHYGPEVTDPVRLHVAAKRYMCAIDPGYIKKLSEVSVRSLKNQGGPMSPDEVRAFDAEPFAQDALAVRRWDDGAKAPNLTTADLPHFRPYLEASLNRPDNSGATA